MLCFGHATRLRACVVVLALLCCAPAAGFNVPQVEHVWPPLVGVHGGAALRVSGDHLASIHGRANLALGCKFGNRLVAAWFVHADVAECHVPAHAEGFVRVELTVNNETAAEQTPTAGANVQFCAEAAVSALFPVAGVASTVVTVRGDSFLPGARCHFADVAVPAAVDSSTLLRCETPPGLALGAVAFGVSNAGDAFKHADVPMEFLHLGNPVLHQLLPQTGPACGGVRADIYVSGFAASWEFACRFGTTTVAASASALADGMLSCVTPAMELRRMPRPLDVTSGNSCSWSVSNSLFFAHRPNVHAVFSVPDIASVVGGGEVALYVDAVPWFASANCRIARFVTPATLQAGVTHCTMPTAAPGFVVLQLTGAGPDAFVSDGVEIMFAPHASVAAVLPGAGPPWGGGLVRFIGMQLRPGMLCRFGTMAVPDFGYWVSSALLVCQQPQLYACPLLVDTVSDHDALHADGAARVEFVCEEPASAMQLQPGTGLDEGGTAVTLLGALWQDSVALVCAFGTIQPVHGARVGPAECRCISPAHATGLVPVQLNQAEQRAPMLQLVYEYGAGASLFNVQLVSEQAALFINGAGFLAGTAVVCTLCGSPLMDGLVLDSSRVICGAPAWLGDGFCVQVLLSDELVVARFPPDVRFAFTERAPTLSHAYPASSSTRGGCLISLLGAQFERTARCAFGDAALVQATVVSSSLLLCESPAQAAGPAGVQVAGPAGHWSHALASFLYEAPLTLAAVQPARSDTSGGTAVHVQLDGRADDSAAFCTFGTISFVRVALLSATAVACTSVAHAPATVPFSLAAYSCAAQSPPTTSHFVFYEAPGVAVVSSGTVPVSASSTLALDWDVLVPQGVVCSIGQRLATLGHVLPQPTLCEVTPGDAGFFVVHLTFEEGSGAAQFQLLAAQPPSMMALFPQQTLAAGGTILTVQGSGFVAESLLCMYDSTVTVPGARISSALVYCETPQQLAGPTATLHVVSDGFSRLGSALAFDIVPVVGIAMLTPSVVSTAGGAVLTISSQSPLENVRSCKVGTFFPLAAAVEKSAVRCMTPAHPAALLSVALSLNGRDVELTTFPLTYTWQPVLLDASPSNGWADGNTELVLQLDVPPRAGVLRCLFDVASSVLSETPESALTCSSPAHAAGFVALLLQIDSNAEDVSSVTFLYRERAAVHALMPSAAPGGGGGAVLHVVGSELWRAGATCCFGADKVPAQFESSVLLRCPIPARAPGLDTVDVDGPVAVAHSSNAQPPAFFTFTEVAAVLALLPDAGDVHGGTAVAVSCTVPQTQCRFGSIGPVVGRTTARPNLVCVSPARSPAAVSLTTADNLVSWSQPTAVFRVLPAPAAAAAVFPERGAASGGDPVHLWVEDASTVLNWLCLFDTIPVRARLSTAGCASSDVQLAMTAPGTGCHGTVFVCTAPAHFVGSVALTLQSEATEYGSSAHFQYAVQPRAAAVYPSGGPSAGGTVLQVVGAHFSANSGAACIFDQMRSPGAVVLSSTLLRCEAPPHPAGSVPLNVALLSTAAPVFTFYTMNVSGVSPPSGPEFGGTTVEVAGSGFMDSALLSCRFGSTFPVAARWASPYVLHCLSPALYPESAAALQYPRAVPVSVSGNVLDCTEALPFEYQPSVRVVAATPRSGIHLGQTPVFIIGAGFVNSTNLACRFGLEVVSATFLSYGNLLCLAPAQAAGPVFLEVSNNGDDFTTDRVIFFYGTCRVGHYCAAGEPLPCPRGAFCAGTANFNFTLCPPGTYQPQIGQAGCLPAPVGYVVPDYGTVYPRLCPRGAVCDVMGLAASAMPCPPGHFCLEGTRTANFTDFRFAERPLPCPFGFYCGPGVSSNKSIANNFTTPQPCYAGYLCEPGSVTPQGSGPCPAGHYCPLGQLIPCPPRTYCPNVANTEPKPCLPGMYNEEYGRATCKQCPRGTVCPGFARDLPEACPPGYVCDQVGLPLPTARCPAGHFCLSNTVTADPLAPLDEEQLLRASPIPLNVSNFRPLPCFPATYCLEGVGNSTTAEGVYFNPQPCNAGSYCEWGTSDRTVQSAAGATDISNPKLPCPAGSYCPTGTFIPIPAPRGSFASGTGNAQPALCLPGTYTHYEGFQRCLACPAGYECRTDGTFKPVICDAGTYRSTRDSITCVSCPVGTWSPYKGLTDGALCIPCNAGLVCGVDGMKNNKPYGDSIQKILNGQITACERSLSDPLCSTVTLQPLGQASLCPEGYVCDARTSFAADKCPDGYFCGYGTTPETQFANLCPAGYFCPAGTTASGKLQFPCIACFYCPAGTGLIMRRCPEGTTSASNAQTINDCKADQITFWRVQPLKTALLARTAIANGLNVSDDNSTAFASLDASAGAGITTNASATSSCSSDLLDVYNAFGRCAPDQFEGLQPAYVLDDDQQPTFDVEGTPLVYFQVPRNYVAKLQFDFRHISDELIYGEHYEVAIFTGDYSTQTTCTESDKRAVPCPPWNPGDNKTKSTMGIVRGSEFETKCPRSTNGLELPFWFARNGLFGQPTDTNNLESPLEGAYVSKQGLMQLNLVANDDVQFRVEVRMLHGLYQAGARRAFLDTMCVDLVGPHRGSSQLNSSFHIIFPRNDDYQIPLNIPLRSTVQRSVPDAYVACNSLNLVATCRYVQPEVTLAFNSSYASEFMLADRYWQRQGCDTTAAANSSAAQPTSYSAYLSTVPDVIALQENVLTDASQYWLGGDPFLAVDYLPFFSACRGFDSNLFLYDVLQTAWTGIDLEGLYKVSYGDGCELVPEDKTKFINQWAPQIFTPVADTCSLEFKCMYQESYASAAAVPRWFEAAGDTLFYLTREPQPRERLFEASVVATDQTTPAKDLSFYTAALAADGLMGVAFGPASGSPAPGSVPKTVTLAMEYFPYSKLDKRLITAEVVLDGYQSASTHDGTYTLAISLVPLGWFDLLNAFAFGTLFYSALFIGIGVLADGLMYAFWGFCRVFTRLRDPPLFKSWPLLGLLVEPQVTGVFLAMMPFYVAELGVQQLFQFFSFIKTFPANVDYLGVSFADESTVNGRVGLCFVVVAVHGLYATSLILIPYRSKSDADGLLDAEDEDDEDGTVDPVRWQRTHFMTGSMLMAVIDLFLAEFSVGNTYSAYLYPCWFMMKIYHMTAQKLMLRYVVDELLFGAIAGINETMETIITIAAGTFTEFALAYYLDVMYACIEELFLEDGMEAVSSQVPRIVFQLEKLYYRVRKRTITEQLLHAAEEEAGSQVESLMGFISGYGPAATGLLSVPFFLYFVWDFNAQLQYTSLWGVTRPDLLLYLLFVSTMIPFQWIMDMFRFNAQEVFQGWKIYDYLKYARYRFRNRTARWKGLETQFDESIEPALRTSDQLCYSNQWYFALALGASSGTLLVLAVQMLLRAQYVMFSDILFFATIGIAGTGCYLGRKAALALADLVSLWKIRSSASDIGDALFADAELQSELVMGGRAPERPPHMNAGFGVGDLTSADLTSDAFRRTFLEANRLWLLDQLSELLTPRTTRKPRGGELSSDDGSDVASVDFERGALKVSDESAFILRQWASAARARVPGRLGRSAPVMSTDDDEDEARYPPVVLTQTASAVLAGWLAASRSSRAAAPTAGVMSSSESDTSSSRPRFPDVQLGMPVQLAAAAWLQQARAQRLAGGAPATESDSERADSADTVSSDSNGRIPAPAALTARARAVALAWLSIVRIRRVVHRVDT